MFEVFEDGDLTHASAWYSFVEVVESGDFEGDGLIGLAVDGSIDCSVGSFSDFLELGVVGFDLHCKAKLIISGFPTEKITSMGVVANDEF